MSRPTFVTINLQALEKNLARVREFANESKVLAMVKANAYGHGMVQVAKQLKNADAFGVASIDEGIKLREAGIKQPIVLIEGLFYAEELELAHKYQFDLVVHNEHGLHLLEKASTDATFKIWLKINTGMNRLGVMPHEVAHLYQRLSFLPSVKKPIGLMTHFSDAEIKDLSIAGKQVEEFDKIVCDYDGPQSLANSAGIMCLPKAHRDWVRPGLMLYGVSPLFAHTGNNDELEPVMTFSSRIIAIQEVKAGDKVGYNGLWTAKEDTRIGVVAAGYGDGYPQQAKNGTPILVCGILCETVGKVSMDMLTVNLSNVPDAKIDDEVIMWGEGLPVAMVALHNQMSAYELLTRMPSRPNMEYK